jgi:hypothetical protein
LRMKRRPESSARRVAFSGSRFFGMAKVKSLRRHAY